MIVDHNDEDDDDDCDNDGNDKDDYDEDHVGVVMMTLLKENLQQTKHKIHLCQQVFEKHLIKDTSLQ